MQKKTEFKVPTEQERKVAIGSFQGTSNLVSKAITTITPLFKPIPKPIPGAWLSEHQEAGQTYEAYLKMPKNKVTPQRKTIYIQPLEESIDESFLMTLKEFTRAYYKELDVEARPLINLKELSVDSRNNSWTGNLQYNAGQILRKLETMVPEDAYCMIAVCMTDLYPRDEWNFVFGLASLQNRVGVFSFARYDENFGIDSNIQQQPTNKDVIVWRSCKVMVHEIGHMFGMPHCIYFDCIMNGSNNLQETSSKPLHLCPVCLRKLQHTIGFNIAERYKDLSEVCSGLGPKFEEAAKWCLEAYTKIMASYGSNYQKYIQEDEAIRKANIEAAQKTQSRQPTQDLKVAGNKTNKPGPTKVTMSGAKKRMDEQIDFYKGL